MRRADFGTLSDPEVSLRDLPRITVRGQTVQGGGGTLRKAPLPSSVLPWSTKRPCGPLAFRRATEGSRVLRKMRGSQEGDKKPFGVLSPSCPRRGYGAKGDGIDSLFSCPITSSRPFSVSSRFSRIYASGLRILTVLHDFLKNFYCKSRKHFGQLETHLCENYNSKHRDQPGTAGASGWIV